MQEKNSKRPPIIELLVIIVDRNKGEKVIRILNTLNVNLQVLSLGKGTADSTMADYFAVDTGEKDVIFALIKLKQAEKILEIINDNLKLDEKNTGIAFTIPVKSAMYSVIEKMGFDFSL